MHRISGETATAFLLRKHGALAGQSLAAVGASLPFGVSRLAALMAWLATGSTRFWRVHGPEIRYICLGLYAARRENKP